MTNIIDDRTDFSFEERKGDRRKNKDTSAGRDFFTIKHGDVTMAGRNRRKDNRRNEREVVDTEGTTLWTNVELSDDSTDITVPRKHQ